MLDQSIPPELSDVGDYATYHQNRRIIRSCEVAAQSGNELDFGRGAEARQVDIRTSLPNTFGYWRAHLVGRIHESGVRPEK